MASNVPELRARIGREGSRWYNERPLPADVAQWFRDIPLHQGMRHEKYVGGIVLIPGKEKTDEIVGYDDHGFPIVREDVWNLTWTPYMKVETRVAYFWDWVEHAGRGQWVGAIEPAGTLSSDIGLPPGFFAYRATSPKAGVGEVRFIGCSMRVRVVEKQSGQPILEGGLGSKIVPTATRWDVDANAVMKAETGAIGRALGVAGMLALPGSGIATAEDMAENLAPSAPLASPEQAALPAEAPLQTPQEQEPDDDVLKGHITELLKVLAKDHPRAYEQTVSWMKGRSLPFDADDDRPLLDEFKRLQLKGTVKKLERVLDEQTRQG